MRRMQFDLQTSYNPRARPWDRLAPRAWLSYAQFCSVEPSESCSVYRLASVLDSLQRGPIDSSTLGNPGKRSLDSEPGKRGQRSPLPCSLRYP